MNDSDDLIMASTSATAQKDEIAYDPEIAKNISPEPTESADFDDAGDSDEDVDLEAEVHVNHFFQMFSPGKMLTILVCLVLVLV